MLESNPSSPQQRDPRRFSPQERDHSAHPPVVFQFQSNTPAEMAAAGSGALNTHRDRPGTTISSLLNANRDSEGEGGRKRRKMRQ